MLFRIATTAKQFLPVLGRAQSIQVQAVDYLPLLRGHGIDTLHYQSASVPQACCRSGSLLTFRKTILINNRANIGSVQCLDYRGDGCAQLVWVHVLDSIDPWTTVRNRQTLQLLKTGRGERIRTSDPHNPIVVRYQAAPRPARARILTQARGYL